MQCGGHYVQWTEDYIQSAVAYIQPVDLVIQYGIPGGLATESSDLGTERNWGKSDWFQSHGHPALMRPYIHWTCSGPGCSHAGG
jgi:hypothetical protein